MILKIFIVLSIWWPIPFAILIISAVEGGIFRLDIKTKQILLFFGIIATIIFFTAVNLV